MNYVHHILVTFTIYAMLGLSLNFVVGYCGRLSLCHGALYGLGAFGSALLTLRWGWGYLPATAASATLVGILAFLLGLPAFKLRNDYFVLATLALQVILVSVLNNWVELTGGPYGLPGIPRPTILGVSLTSPAAFLAFSVTMGVIALFVSWQLVRSPYGRAVRSVRDDPLAAMALGKNSRLLHASAFGVSAVLAAIAGSVWGAWTSYIDPTDFGLDAAVAMLTLVVIGGTGTLVGPIAGAAFMVLMPEAIRLVGIPGPLAAPMQQMLFGLILILVMRFRREGLLGGYAFD